MEEEYDTKLREDREREEEFERERAREERIRMREWNKMEREHRAAEREIKMDNKIKQGNSKVRLKNPAKGKLI